MDLAFDLQRMPYALRFAKPVAITDPDQYINDCCIGGDRVLDRLLPALRQRYGDLQSNQEDWGWFAWFDDAGTKLAVDIFTNDHERGQFQIHLTSRRPRLILGDRIEDRPELDALRDLVVAELRSWPVSDLVIERVNEK